MVKVEIEVDQILTSAVALEVEPGDKLLVTNGVVIGLVARTERPSDDARESVSRRPALLPPPAGPSELEIRREAIAAKSAEDRVIQVIRSRAPITARQITANLRDNQVKVRHVLHRLRDKGVITATSEKRLPEYVIAGAQPNELQRHHPQG